MQCPLCLCRTLFEETEAEAAAAAAAAPPAKAAQARGGKSAFKLNSVGAQFRTQLRGLMGDLSQCAPHFIRCALFPMPPNCLRVWVWVFWG